MKFVESVKPWNKQNIPGGRTESTLKKVQLVRMSSWAVGCLKDQVVILPEALNSRCSLPFPRLCSVVFVLVGPSQFSFVVLPSLTKNKPILREEACRMIICETRLSGKRNFVQNQM